MNFRHVTTWDRLDLAYPSLHDSVRGRGPLAMSLRCTARIEAYEAAANALEERGQDDPVTRRLLGSLGNDYRARVEHWSVRSPKVPDHPALAGLMIGVVGMAGPAALIAAMYADGELFSLTWWQTGLVTLPIVLPVGYLLCRSVRRTFAVDFPPAQALLERRCSDCGITLDVTGPGIPRGLIGVDVGPRMCQACDRPWPLVPPPADALDEGEQPQLV